MTLKKSKAIQYLFYLTFCTILTACSNGNNNNSDPVTREYQINITNLTAGQPFSPLAIIAHTTGYSLFTIGQPASAGLELIAEGGSTTDLISEAEANSAVITTLSGTGPVAPGAQDSFTITVNENQASGLLLTTATMLVNSNDAFTALNGFSIDSMTVGDTLSVNTISYDSGTEANSELTGTMPGPADGGEGFNVIRDDIIDEVHMHSGVLTADDGLATSVLNELHRWDNPVARISVTRTQ